MEAVMNLASNSGKTCVLKGLKTRRRLLIAIVPISLTAIVAGCGGSSSDAPAPVTSAQVPCESLVGTPLGDGTIQTAQSVAAGSYTPPGQTKTKTGLPAFCRVTAAMHPTADSN